MSGKGRHALSSPIAQGEERKFISCAGTGETPHECFAWGQASEVTRALDVAEAVWRAANDSSCPMRVAAGADAVALSESC